MPQLEQHSVRLIEALTDAGVRARAFDLEIQVDNLKYSGWLSALGTAGIALLITHFREVVPSFDLPGVPRVAGPILAALALTTSIGVGGFFHWTMNKSFSRKRQKMTLIIKQECLLYSGDATIEAGDDVFVKLAHGQYLSPEDQKRLDELDKESKREPNEERMLMVQGALVLVGFIIAFVGAIRV